MKKYTNHFRHYIPLLGILAVGLFGFISFTYDKNFQFTIAVSASLAYVFWGLIHHYIHNDLSVPVILEYVIIAALGIVVVYSLIV